jgi:hypothetical protein
MLNNVYEKNVSNFINKGMSIKQAKTEAGRLRADAKSEIQKLLK